MTWDWKIIFEMMRIATNIGREKIGSRTLNASLNYVLLLQKMRRDIGNNEL